MSTDQITVIRPLNGYLAKTISKKRITPEANHLKFKAETRDLNGIESLSALLLELESDPTAAVVRGKLKSDANPENHYRRLAGREDGTGFYMPAMRHWFMVDIDKLPMTAIGDLNPKREPADVVDAIIRHMGMTFREAACHWQFSSSQGFKEGKHISVHLWFWSDITVSDEDMMQFMSVMNAQLKSSLGLIKDPIDLVLYNPVQIHFTAAPILEDVEEPLPKRSGFRKGNDAVKLSKISPFNKKHNFLKCLESLGDHDEGRGFREPILAASTAFVSEYGKPTPAFASEFKAAVQRRIGEAYKSDARREEEVERYRSDLYLDSILASAARKFGDNVLKSEAAGALLEQFVYLEPKNAFYDVDAKEIIPVNALDNTYKYLDKSVSSQLFNTQELRRVHRIQTIPGEKDRIVKIDGRRIYNNWYRPQVQVIREDTSIWDDHIAYIFEGFDYEAEFFKQWLAHVILRPGVRIRFMPILGGHQGIGKSLFVTAIAAVAGQWNIAAINSFNLKEKYNSYLIDSEVVYVDELMAMGRLELYNHLKPFVTEDVVTVREMGVNPYNAKIFCNMFATTNYADALRLDRDERRAFVHFAEVKRRDPKYYSELFEMIKYAPGLLVHWAEQIDLSDFNPSAPPIDTEAKRAMHELSHRVGVRGFLEDALDAREWPFKCDLVKVNDIVHAMGNRYGRVTTDLVADILKGRGFKQHQVIWRTSDGKKTKPKIWVIGEFEYYWRVPTSDWQGTYFRPGDKDDADLDDPAKGDY